jgi:hypothetical protein
MFNLSKNFVRLCSALFVIALSGCGPSDKEIQAQKNASLEKEYFSVFKEEITLLKANRAWVKNLNINRKNKFAVIYKAELEKEWIDNAPIAFVGNISEISSYGAEDYKIRIKLDSINSKIFLKDNLGLVLSCQKSMVDRAIKESRENFKDRLGSGASVGVIAEIFAVSRVEDKDETEKEMILLGHGECQKIVALPQKYSIFFEGQ